MFNGCLAHILLGLTVVLGSSETTLCPAGFASSTGLVPCSACSPGSIPNSPSFPNGTTENGVVFAGATSCVSCPASTFQSDSGALVCESCRYPTTTMSPRSTECQECVPNFFENPLTGECDPCVENAFCPGGHSLPVPQAGYWTDRGKLAFFAHPQMQPCWTETCKGAVSDNAVTYPDCWTANGFHGSQCNSSRLMCGEGSTGAFCQQCIEGYYYFGGVKKCASGHSQNPFELGFATMTFLGTAIFILLVFLRINKRAVLNNLPSRVRNFFVLGIIWELDVASIKLFFSSLFVIYYIGDSASVCFPYPFSNFVNSREVFDATSPFWGPSKHEAAVYYLLFCRDIAILGLVRLLWNFIFGCTTKTRTQAICAQHGYLISAIVWYFTPFCLFFAAYDMLCVETPSGGVRMSNTSDSCRPIERGLVLQYILLAAKGYGLVLLGLPLVFFFFLFTKRSALNPPLRSKQSDDNLTKYFQSKDSSITPLWFLYNDFHPRYWWFDCFLMYERAALVVVPLTAKRESRPAIGAVLALLSTLIATQIRPYFKERDNTLFITTRLSILVAYGVSNEIVNDSEVYRNSGSKFGWILLSFTLSGIVFIFVFALQGRNKRLEERKVKSLKAQKSIELACEFTNNKFTTSLDAVARSSLPPAHALVYHYCSLKDASRALLSGIPAEKSCEGCLFTTKPHYCEDDADGALAKLQKAFKSTDVMLAVAVEAKMLVRSDADPSLVVLRCSVLSALRPKFYADVIDKGPWFDRQLILPPQGVIRAYQFCTSSVKAPPPTQCIRDTPLNLGAGPKIGKSPKVSTMSPRTCSELLQVLSAARKRVVEQDLVPLYHYTTKTSAKYILKSGFRMSTQGQGDGGIYFSTRGPASYDVGKDTYEENLVIDCFGVERLAEYRGKNKLDVCIVYGLEPRILRQAPGGRTNAKMVSKTTLKDLSLSEAGSYFLRPDRIAAAIVLDQPLSGRDEPDVEDALAKERSNDRTEHEKLRVLESNTLSYGKKVQMSLPTFFDSENLGARLQARRSERFSQETAEGLEGQQPRTSQADEESPEPQTRPLLPGRLSSQFSAFNLRGSDRRSQSTRRRGMTLAGMVNEASAEAQSYSYAGVGNEDGGIEAAEKHIVSSLDRVLSGVRYFMALCERVGLTEKLGRDGYLSDPETPKNPLAKETELVLVTEESKVDA